MEVRIKQTFATVQKNNKPIATVQKNNKPIVIVQKNNKPIATVQKNNKFIATVQNNNKPNFIIFNEYDFLRWITSRLLTIIIFFIFETGLNSLIEGR